MKRIVQSWIALLRYYNHRPIQWFLRSHAYIIRFLFSVYIRAIDSRVSIASRMARIRDVCIHDNCYCYARIVVPSSFLSRSPIVAWQRLYTSHFLRVHLVTSLLLSRAHGATVSFTGCKAKNNAKQFRLDNRDNNSNKITKFVYDD